MLTEFANTWQTEAIQKLHGYVFWGVSDAFRGLFADLAGFSGARFNMLALFGVFVSDVRVVSRITNPSGNVLHRINIPLCPLLGSNHCKFCDIPCLPIYSVLIGQFRDSVCDSTTAEITESQRRLSPDALALNYLRLLLCYM